MNYLLLLLCLCGTIHAYNSKDSLLKREKEDPENEPITYSLCENDNGHMYYYKYTTEDNNYCGKHVARAKYTNAINKTGWAYLEVEVANHHMPHYMQGYAAGFIEGRATRDLIRLHIANTVEGYCDYAEQYCEDLNEYLLQNLMWMKKEIEENPNDEYWIQVNMTLNQLVGMVNGYEGNLNEGISLEALVAHPIYLIQLAGDIEDLSAKFNKPENPTRIKTGRGKCSALVKALPNFSDILFSHVTWSSYSSMLRMQKKYMFKTKDAGRTYTFSGYPGGIASTDDFVLTSSQLAIFETTIGNYNETLYQFMTPTTVLTWVRTQIAHRTATSGREWANTFAKHNSGTYNNQWVIVDYKKLRKGHKKQHHGLIHVLEQMPKHIVHSDMTGYLEKSLYWPSYNTPYFTNIFKWSEATKMVEKYGDWYTYDKTPRALIFKRDHNNVVDMESMITLMRSNNYTRDPLSACECNPPYSAENAISCRSELNPATGTYPFESLGFRDHGATDMKLTNSALMKSLRFSAIAGPTHGPTPIFDWDTAPFEGRVPHYGQPNRWTFKSVIHKWSRHGLYN